MGPLDQNDPRHAALLTHLSTDCPAQRDAVGGCGGFVYGLVESACEWMDGNLPPDLGSRRDRGAGGVSAAVQSGLHSADLEGEEAAVAARWWELEEADGDLIRAATKEAAAAHWSKWRGEEQEGAEEEGEGQSRGAPQQQQPAVSESAAIQGQRGAWSFVVGLVSDRRMGGSGVVA